MSSKPGSGLRAKLPGAKSLQNAVISAVRWGRRRGCRAAGSPACCRHRASARAFAGSTPAGGHNTPSDLRQFVAERLVALPGGRALPARWCPAAPAASARNRSVRAGAGGAVWAGGVAGVGGACALAAPDAAIRTQAEKERVFDPHARENGLPARRFRSGTADFRICGSGSAKNAPSAASGGARSG